MPRKTGKNVAKKSRSRSTIRNQKVSRSSRRNSGRNSVVKRKKKSRRKQRGRGNNNPGEYTADSEVRPLCKDQAAVNEAANTFNYRSGQQKVTCFMSNEQCAQQGENLRIFGYTSSRDPVGTPCLEKDKFCRKNTTQSGASSYQCV